MKVGAAWGWDGRGGVRLRGCEWKAEGAGPSQSRREVCFGGCDDSVTIWGRRGAGWGWEDGEGGLNRRKANAYRWDGGWGAYWSAVCLLFRRSVANRGPGVYISQCGDEDAPSGDMEMYSRLCNLASLHVAYIFTPPPHNVCGRRHWPQRSKSCDFS